VSSWNGKVEQCSDAVGAGTGDGSEHRFAGHLNSRYFTLSCVLVCGCGVVCVCVSVCESVHSYVCLCVFWLVSYVCLFVSACVVVHVCVCVCVSVGRMCPACLRAEPTQLKRGLFPCNHCCSVYVCVFSTLATHSPNR
jgi:hypothetical protein